MTESKKDTGELMYVQCSYCREWLDVKPGQMNEITHSICPVCMKKIIADPKKASQIASPKPQN